jgi:hypothetical protein
MKIFKQLSLAMLLLSLLALGTGCKKTLKDRLEEAEGPTEEQQYKADRKAEAESRLEYLDEWKEFRSDAEARIAANTKRLAELKATADDKLAATIADLQKQDDALQKQIDTYKDEGKVGWDAFKRDFTHTLAAVDKSVKALPGGDGK